MTNSDNMSTTAIERKQFGIHEARNQLGELLNRVQYQGEEFAITRNGKPVALLVPIPEAEHPNGSAA